MANTPITSKRVLVLFDVHVPHEDPTAIKIAQAFKDDWKPHIVVMGGDLQDVGQVSTFANDDNVDLADEFDQSRELIKKMGVTHWMEGNHEERLRRVGLVKPELRKMLDPVRNLELREQGIQTRRYDNRTGFFQFGKLRVLHGWFWNQYFARSTAEAYGCSMFGHAHRFQTLQAKHVFEDRTGFGVGMPMQARPAVHEGQAPPWLAARVRILLSPPQRAFQPLHGADRWQRGGNRGPHLPALETRPRLAQKKTAKCRICGEADSLHGGYYRGSWGHCVEGNDGEVYEGWDLCFECYLHALSKARGRTRSRRGHITHLIASGATQADIARKLGVSVRTVTRAYADMRKKLRKS